MSRVNTQRRCREMVKSHFNRIMSYCLSLAGKHCLQLKRNTAEVQKGRMQTQCLRSVPGSSWSDACGKSSETMANSLQMCEQHALHEACKCVNSLQMCEQLANV